MHCTSIFALVFFCFFFTCNAANLVPSVCKDILNTGQNNITYDFCVAKLESDPKSSNSTAIQLAGISFQLAISKTKEVVSAINKALNGSSNLDELNILNLKKCTNNHIKFPEHLTHALKDLNGGKYGGANKTVTGVMVMAFNCGDGLYIPDHWKGDLSDLSLVMDKNDDFYKLTAISLGFTKLLSL